MPNRRLIVALGTGAVSLTLYLSTMIRVHEGDAFEYAYAVRQGAIQGLFHPNHLLYDVIARLNFVLWQSVGWQGDSFLPSQFFNAITGALGIAIFTWILLGMVKNPWLVVASAAGLAMSFAYWYHSIELAVHILPAVFVLSAFAIAVRNLERPTLVKVAALGIVSGLSVLFLQSNILFLLAAGTAILVTDANRLRRVQHGMLFLAFAAVPILIGYLALPCIFLNLCGFQPVFHWTMGYARLPWYGFHGSRTLYYAALGIGRSIFGGIVVPASVADNVIGVLGRGQYALPLVPFGLTLGLVFLVLLGIRGLWKTQSKITTVLLVWLFTFGALAVWWEPGNVKYWIPTLPPLFFLVGLSCQQLWLRIKPKPAGRQLFRIATIATLLIIGSTSYLGGVRPLLDGSSDVNMKLTQDLGPYVKDSDLVVVPKDYYAFPAYLKFYAGKQATTLHYLAEGLLVNPDLKKTTYDSYFDAEYRNVLQRDGRVYVVNNGFEIPGWTVDRKLVSREAADRMISTYSLQPITRFSDGNTLYELKRSSTANSD